MLPLIISFYMPIIILLVLGSIVAACMDRLVIAGLSYAATLAVTYFTFSSSPGIQELIASYGIVKIAAITIPIYISLGLGVALIKWGSFMSSFADTISRIMNSFVSTDGNPEPTDMLRKRLWSSAAITKFNNTYHKATPLPGISDEAFIELLVPSPKEHLSRITMWMLEWPFVLLALLVDNFVIRLVEHIVNMFSGVFKRIGKYFVGAALSKIAN